MSATDGPRNLLSSFSFRSKEERFGGSGRHDLSGLTLDAVLGTATTKPKPPPQLYPSPSLITRTLLDVIRDEEELSSSRHKDDDRDRKAWRSFKDRLKLRRAGNGAWTANHPTPVSDGPIQNLRNQNSVNSHPYSSEGSDLGSKMDDDDDEGDHRVRRVQFRDLPGQSSTRPVMARRTSTRIGSDPVVSGESDGHPPSLRPQFTRHNSTRAGSSARFLNRCESPAASKDEPGSEAEERLARLAMADNRQMSARQAAAAQEASEAVAAAEAAAAAEEEDGDGGSGSEGSEEGEGTVRMSLMDLLEETDKEMGWEGSKYMVGDDEDDEDEYEDEDDADADEYDSAGEMGEGRYEWSCCACMVKHRGEAVIPCGHSYCKLCTKEMYVSRGFCPLCNGFIQEILSVF